MKKKQRQTSSRLTGKQTRLFKQLNQIFSILGLDYQNIKDYPEAEERTAHLERILHHVVLGEVISQITLLDELLTDKLVTLILGKRGMHSRNSKRFRTLRKTLVDSRLPVSRKLEMLRLFIQVPSTVDFYFAETAKLRNTLAHRFFVDTSPSTKLVYKSKSIFQADGIDALFKDFQQNIEFFIGMRLHKNQ